MTNLDYIKLKNFTMTIRINDWNQFQSFGHLIMNIKLLLFAWFYYTLEIFIGLSDEIWNYKEKY